MKRPGYILPIIIFSQFSGTSLWFAGNAIMGDLQQVLALPDTALGNITSAVQFGFIAGTLTFAFLLIADRFSPSRVFFVSSICGALFNLSVFLLANNFASLLFLRFMTGFCLAGIYPVGMKIAADWYARDLEKALGYLVGALVLGTAFPHLLKYQAATYPWYLILFITSAVAVLGGWLIFQFVPDGPNRTKGSRFQPGVIIDIFRYREFRSAAFGYFGHMWELYAFWAFIPFLISSYIAFHNSVAWNVSLWSFMVIAAGGLGCVLGGYISLNNGSAKVAWWMLLTSGLCCLFSPFLFFSEPLIFGIFLFIWGGTVIGDSPQFSTLVAQTAPGEYVGSALTIVNCIGFSITIFSIELINWGSTFIAPQFIFLLLIVGPVFGLFSIGKLLLRGSNPKEK